MTKSEARQVYLNRRMTLSKKDIQELSIKIAKIFMSNIDVHLKRISLFQTIHNKNEIDTSYLTKLILEAGGNIAIPKWDIDTNKLTHFAYESIQHMERNAYGIPEPMDGNELNLEQIDLVCVPLLVTDSRGYRVGYGKGVYDQLLTNSKVEKVGLSFFEEIDLIYDIQTYDVCLDKCIFPDAISLYERTAR